MAKPPQFVPLLEDLGQPRTIPMSAPPADLHAFLRAVGWSAWVKGPFHDALRVPGWEEFDALAARLWRYWPFEGAHLQAHVDGIHESIGFAAHRGRLLDAIWIVKNDMTAAGKTTAASRRDMREADHNALAEYVATLSWTGGGEVELVRSQDGRPWLIEINPRFPSWVAGRRPAGHQPSRRFSWKRQAASRTAVDPDTKASSGCNGRSRPGRDTTCSRP